MWLLLASAGTWNFFCKDLMYAPCNTIPLMVDIPSLMMNMKHLEPNDIGEFVSHLHYIGCCYTYVVTIIR